jgi:hypothetical protein
MKRLVLVPHGWPCSLLECRPGLFLSDEYVGFKSEYGGAEVGNIEAFNEAGEFFWGGAKTHEERGKLVVQPMDYVWEEYEE